jgi:DNA-binding beta-propeller fold protein YncE
MAMTPDGSTLYVSGDTDTVTPIDTATNTAGARPSRSPGRAPRRARGKSRSPRTGRPPTSSACCPRG